MGNGLRVIAMLWVALGCSTAWAQPSGCQVEPQHQAQLMRHEAGQLQDLQRRYGAHVVSPRTQRVFERLLQHGLPGRMDGTAWRLSGYGAATLNAHAAHGGSVLVSRGLDDPKLPEPVVAAGLAHEIAHVLLHHSLERACAALQWMAPALSAGTAAPASAEEAGRRVRELMQAQELQADAQAVELLHAAGYPPRALSQLLMRLAPRVPTSDSASHPDHVLRLGKALRAEAALR